MIRAPGLIHMALSFAVIYMLEMLSPDYWATTSQLRASLAQMRQHPQVSAEDIAKRLCRTRDYRSIRFVISCLHNRSTLEKMGAAIITNDILDEYGPLCMATCRIVDEIARNSGNRAEEMLLLLFNGPYHRYKFNGHLGVWHNRLSIQGLLLAFRHLRCPSTKTLALLENYHLYDPDFKDEPGQYMPWDSRCWDAINTALYEMGTHGSLNILAERYACYSKKTPRLSPNLPHDLYLRHVGTTLVLHRRDQQVCDLAKRIIAKRNNDSAVAYALIRRLYGPTMLSQDDMMVEMPAHAWSDVKLGVLITHLQFIVENAGKYERIARDPAIQLAFVTIAKLVATRATFPAILPPVVAWLDNKDYSTRQTASMVFRIMYFLDSKECTRLLAAQKLSPEVHRRLAEIMIRQP